MSAHGSGLRRRGWPAGLLLVAACQPLPHPFAYDKPPAGLLAIHDSAGVTVAPISGGPAKLAGNLGPAVAAALLKRDIPASDETTSLGSYQLSGHLSQTPPSEGMMAATAQWRLVDARGRLVGERDVSTEATSAEWDDGGAAPIARLAEASAAKLAPLIEDTMPGAALAAPPPGVAGEVGATSAAPPVLPAASPPPEGQLASEGKPSSAAVKPKPPANPHVQVAIEGIKGAPGDGASALANAVAAVLRQQPGLTVIDDKAKADLLVAAEIGVTAAGPNSQHVKIVWHVRRPGGGGTGGEKGGEIGQVAQENDVPNGTLSGPWGDIAYNIAMAAGGGLLQLVARGMPPPKS
jgi:hypothetical protein